MHSGGRQPHGFTIIEVMIFLAVSGIILVSALTLLNNKQGKTAFFASMKNIVSQLNTDISYVSNGYYRLPGGVQCTVSNVDSPSARPSISAGASAVGTNFGCTYIGMVLQFDPAITNGQYQFISYPIVGLQYQQGNPSIGVATSISEAAPVAMYPSTYSTYDGTSTDPLPYGISVCTSGCAISSNNGITWSDSSFMGGATQTAGAVGFITTFNSYTNANNTNLNTGSQHIQLVPIPGSTLGSSQSNIATLINNLTNNGTNTQTSNGTTYYGVEDPSSGIDICFNSGTSHESAFVTIGGSNSSQLVTMQEFSKLGC